MEKSCNFAAETMEKVANMLQRKIIDRLEKWYQSGHYKAPLVFGARQVGKTTARHNLPPIVYGIIDIGKVFGNATFLPLIPQHFDLTLFISS